VLLIGSASSRRSQLLEAAAQTIGLRVSVIDWRDVLRDDAAADARIERALADGHAWCKIDPPSDDPQTVDAFIQEGFRLSHGDAAAPRPLRHGELAYTHWWYAGFMSTLTRLERRLQGLRLFTPIEQIGRMCDKLACQRHLANNTIDVPALLGEVASLDAFEAQYPPEDAPAVFIKSRYGSSAAGVVALRRHRDGRMRAYSSARIASDAALYSHLKISVYSQREAVRSLVDALAEQGAYAERWIAKPRAPVASDANYDLRVVAFCGRPRQRIARISRSPMTNLHLGNRRSAPHWLSARQIDAIESAVSQAASAFASSLSIGFDVVLQASRACVLEANAFGDLLPGLEFEGAGTFDDQVRRVRLDER
jgi:glutathione synthase/RimK-type ligase-like ATP-grasp enzyme